MNELLDLCRQRRILLLQSSLVLETPAGSYYRLMQAAQSQGVTSADTLREIRDHTDRIEASFASKRVATLDRQTGCGPIRPEQLRPALARAP